MNLDFSKFEKFKRFDDYHLNLKPTRDNLISNNLVKPSKKSRKESFGAVAYNNQELLSNIYDNKTGKLKLTTGATDLTIGDEFNNPWNFYNRSGKKIIDIEDYWPLKPKVLAKNFLDSEISSGLVKVSDSTPLLKDEGGNQELGPPPNAVKRKGEIYCICEVDPNPGKRTNKKIQATIITDVWSGLAKSEDGTLLDPKPPNPFVLNMVQPTPAPDGAGDATLVPSIPGKYGGQYDPIVIAYFGGFSSTINIMKGAAVAANGTMTFEHIATDLAILNAMKDLIFLVNSVYIRIGPAPYDYKGEKSALSGTDMLKLIVSYSGGKYTDAMIKRANQVLQKISTSVPNSFKAKAKKGSGTDQDKQPPKLHCKGTSEILITQTDPYHCEDLANQLQPTIFVQSGIRLNLFSDIMIHEHNNTVDKWDFGSDCFIGQKLAERATAEKSGRIRRMWKYENNFGGPTSLAASPSTGTSIKFEYYYKTQELTGFTFKNWQPIIPATGEAAKPPPRVINSLGRNDLWYDIIKARSFAITGIGASSDIKNCAINLIFKDTLKSVNTLTTPGDLTNKTTDIQKKIPEFSTIPNSYLRMPVKTIINPAVPSKTEDKAYLLEVPPISESGLTASILAVSLLSVSQYTTLTSGTSSDTKIDLKNSLFGRYSPQFIDFISESKITGTTTLLREAPDDKTEMNDLYGDVIVSLSPLVTAKALDFYGKIKKEQFQFPALPEIIPALKNNVVKFIQFGADSEPPTPEGIVPFKTESVRNSALKTHYKGCTAVDIERYTASDRNLAKCNDPSFFNNDPNSIYIPRPRYLFLLPYGTPGTQKSVISSKMYGLDAQTRNRNKLDLDGQNEGGQKNTETLGSINDGGQNTQTIGSTSNSSGGPKRVSGGYDSNIENMDVGNAEQKSSEAVLAAVQACRDQMKNAAEEKKNDPDSNPDCEEGQIAIDTNEIPITADAEGNVLEPTDAFIYRVDQANAEAPKILSKYFYKTSGNGTWYGRCEATKQAQTVLKNFVGNTGCGPSTDIITIINKIGINWAKLDKSKGELNGRTELTTNQALKNLIETKVNSAKTVVPTFTSKELRDNDINTDNLKTNEYIKIQIDGEDRYYRPLGPSSNVASGDTQTNPRDLFPFLPTEKDKDNTIMLNYVCSNDTTKKCSDIPNGVCKVEREKIFTGIGILQSDYNIATGVTYDPKSSFFPCIWALTEAGKNTIGADVASKGVKKINKDSSTLNIGLKIMKTQKKFVWNIKENVQWTAQSSEPSEQALHASIGTSNEAKLYAQKGNKLNAPTVEIIGQLYKDKVKNQDDFFTVADVGAFYQSCDPHSGSVGAGQVQLKQTKFPIINGRCKKGDFDENKPDISSLRDIDKRKWVVQIPACAGIPTIVNPQCGGGEPTAAQLKKGNCAPVGVAENANNAYIYPIYLQFGQPDTCNESIINIEAETDSDVDRSQITNAVGIGGSVGIEQFQTVNVKLGGGFACKSISNDTDRINCYNQNSCFSRAADKKTITANKWGGTVLENYVRAAGNDTGPGQCLYFPPTNNMSTEKLAEKKNKLEGIYYDTVETSTNSKDKNTLNIVKANRMNPKIGAGIVGPGWPEVTSDEDTTNATGRCSTFDTKNPLCGTQNTELFTSGVGTIQNLTTWDNEAVYNKPTRVGLLKYANSCKDACETFANNTVHKDKYLKGIELQNAIANVYTPEEYILSAASAETYGEKFLDDARNNYVCKCPIKKFKPSTTCACDMTTNIFTEEMRDNLTKNGLEITQQVADDLKIDSLTNAATSQTKIDDLIYTPTKFNGRTCISVDGPNKNQLDSLLFPVSPDGTKLLDEGPKTISGLSESIDALGVRQQLPASSNSINFLARLPKCGACEISNSQKQNERVIVTDIEETKVLNAKGGANLSKEVKLFKGICQKIPLSGNELVAENAEPSATGTPSAIGPNSKPIAHVPKFLAKDGKCYVPHTVKRVNNKNVPINLEIEKGKFATIKSDPAVGEQVNTAFKYQNNSELEAIFRIENRCRLKAASSQNDDKKTIVEKIKTTTKKKESDCPTGYENFYGKLGLPPMAPDINDADKLRLIPCCTEQGPKLPCKPKGFRITNPRISNVQICSQAMAEGENGEHSGLAKLMNALGADQTCVQSASASGSATAASVYAKGAVRADAPFVHAQASFAAGAGFATQHSQMNELTSGCKTVMANILKSSSVINNLACSINSTKINSTLEFTSEKSAILKTLPASAELLAEVNGMIANNKAVLESALTQVGQIISQGAADADAFKINCVGPIQDKNGIVVYDDPRRLRVPNICGSYDILNFARDQTSDTNKTIEKLLDRSLTIKNSSFDFSTTVTLNNSVQSQTQNSTDMLADSITQQGASNTFASSLTAGAGAGTDPAASVSSLNSQEISKRITQSAFSLNEQIININTRANEEGNLYLEAAGPITIDGVKFDFSSVTNIANNITAKSANEASQTAKTKNNQEAFNSTKQQKDKRGVDDIARELGIANANALRAVGENVGLDFAPEPTAGAQTLQVLIIAIAVVGSLIAVGGIVGTVFYVRRRQGRKKSRNTATGVQI